MSAASMALAHAQFEAALPAITSTARYAFRRRRYQDRAEAVAEAQAAAWSAWAGLLKKGKDPVTVGVHGIANNAVRYVRNGRRLGHRGGGRGSMDVYHFKAQSACGFRVVGLDRDADIEPGKGSDAWKQWLACDNRVGPADEAAFRIDFAAWLDSLPTRRRRVAELLAEGHETGVVARMLGVTPGAISQARTWLASSWRQFQSDESTDRDGLAVATV